MRRLPLAALLVLCLSTASAAATRTIGPGDNVQAALAQLRPGDTLYLQAGTYPCSNCFDHMPGGTSSQRVTVAAVPGETVTINLTSDGNGVNFSTSRRSYITFDGLHFNAKHVKNAGIKITCGSSSTDYSHHIRLINVELFSARTQGILANAGQCNRANQGFNEVIKSHIHDNGSDPQLDHGLYFASSDNVIDNTIISNNRGCGVHIYTESGSADRNTVRNSRVFGQTGRCGVGILMGSGEQNMAYNNLAYGNNGGIMVGNGGSGNQVYNNTIANNREWCLRNDNQGTTIRNNICANNPAAMTGKVPPTASNNLMDIPGD